MCQMFYVSVPINLENHTQFFQPVIWTDAFKGNFKSRQIFISPSDRTNIFQQFWIGPVVLEKTMKMWKVNRRTDRWTIDDRCSEVQHCCIASSKHILSEMKAKFKPLVRIKPFTHYFFTQPYPSYTILCVLIVKLFVPYPKYLELWGLDAPNARCSLECPLGPC